MDQDLDEEDEEEGNEDEVDAEEEFGTSDLDGEDDYGEERDSQMMDGLGGPTFSRYLFD